jgi:hypothetical protein
MLGVTTE